MSCSGNITTFTYGVSINSNSNFDIAAYIYIIRFAGSSTTILIVSSNGEDVRMVLGMNFSLKSIIIDNKVIVNTVNCVGTVGQGVVIETPLISVGSTVGVCI